MFVMQATQVRKSKYVREKGVDYDPDTHRTCTVHAGTVVQQVNERQAVIQRKCKCN